MSVSQTQVLHVLAQSHTENLSPYLEAFAAKAGITVRVERLLFGTLMQTLIANGSAGEGMFKPHMAILLIYPWDLTAALDWRQFNEKNSESVEDLAKEVRSNISLMVDSGLRVLFVDAPLPPVLHNSDEQRQLTNLIRSVVHFNGWTFVPREFFSLDNYVESGMGIANHAAYKVASLVIENITAKLVKPIPKKVIITDLDNTAWQGVVGEDGVNGIQCLPKGTSKRHYYYLQALKRLASSGAVICVVSKNDLDLARKPFEKLDLPIKLSDISSFKVGYGVKSHMIKALAQELNLPLDSVVFIDDNPVEIAEVSTELGDVVCLEFPELFENIPSLINNLQSLFSLQALTDEDTRRSKLYKLRAKAEEEKTSHHAIDDFLKSLAMTFTLYDRSDDISNAHRAIQLINKTNQFNLNGIRLEHNQVLALLDSGAKLFSASVNDKFGDHGEVVACLIDAKGVIQSFVMSCRILQRQVEYYFLSVLIETLQLKNVSLNVVITSRNTPLQDFLQHLGFSLEDNIQTLPADRLLPKLSPSRNFFNSPKL